MTFNLGVLGSSPRGSTTHKNYHTYRKIIMTPISALHEMLATRVWWMSPELIHACRDAIVQNVATRTPVESAATPLRDGWTGESIKLMGMQAYKLECGALAVKSEEVDPYTQERREATIHVMRVNGPILRNAGMCAVGSIEQKEEIIAAANEGVMGHIIIINSGGGCATSIHDYEDAMNYCREKGQPVVAFVRGTAASAAYALAACCDHILTYSEYDSVGCIGCMAAFFTNKDGDKNSITQETYREVYATKSPKKNEYCRRVADGDYELVQKLVDDGCEEFHELLNRVRPQVTDEQKEGDTYDAKDVIGTLVDGVGDFQTAVDKVVEMAGDILRKKRQAASTAR